jgi:hypothetical protein
MIDSWMPYVFTNKTYEEKCQEMFFLFVNINQALVEFAGRI